MNKITKNQLAIIIAVIVPILTGCMKDEVPLVEVPVITTTAISNITETTATSGGNITDEGSSTVLTRGVCWSTGTTPTINDSKTNDGAGAGSFSSNIVDLFGGTTYFVRAYATNSKGVGYGMGLSFKTSGQPPSAPFATTFDATNITTLEAILNAKVNAMYYSTLVTFEYGTTTSYGSTATAIQSPVTGGTDTNVSVTISGLTAGEIYHYRVKAVNSLGTTYGNDLTFTTLGKVPTVIALAATSTIPLTSQLNGTVNPNYLLTTVTFEYGTTTNYGSTVVATQSPVTGSSSINVSATITELSPCTIYHFRIAAVNELGTTTSNDMIFDTYIVGTDYQGGKIGYILQTGDAGYVAGEQHGLIVAPTDQSTGAPWGCNGTTISGADGTTIGAGNQNTIDIVTSCTTAGIAAKLCYDLILNGYSDWYLPSKNELRMLYLYRNMIGGFGSNFYWSSTEGINMYGAWAQYFTNGNQFSNDKFAAGNVRAVRAF